MGNPLSVQGGFDKIGVVNWYMYGKKSFGQSAFEKFEFSPPTTDADLHEDICIVTGANSGLGYTTALEFAKAKAQVHMICRNEDRGKKALQQIQDASSSTSVYLHIADMASPQSVKKVAADILKETNSRINVIVNNAGVLCEVREVKKNEAGKELDASWATMIGGTYLLTGLFKDALLSEGKKGHRVRVIDVSSGGHYTSRLEDSDPLGWKEGNKRQNKNYRGDLEYGMNKRAQVYINAAWARYFNSQGAEAPLMASMHPGWSNTPGVQKMYPAFYESNKDNFRTQEAGADTIVWLAAAPIEEIKSNADKESCLIKSNETGLSGLFWLDRYPAVKELRGTFNELVTNTEKLLWQQMQEWTGTDFEYPEKLN